MERGRNHHKRKRLLGVRIAGWLRCNTEDLCLEILYRYLHSQGEVTRRGQWRQSNLFPRSFGKRLQTQRPHSRTAWSSALWRSRVHASEPGPRRWLRIRDEHWRLLCSPGRRSYHLLMVRALHVLRRCVPRTLWPCACEPLGIHHGWCGLSQSCCSFCQLRCILQLGLEPDLPKSTRRGSDSERPCSSAHFPSWQPWAMQPTPLAESLSRRSLDAVA